MKPINDNFDSNPKQTGTKKRRLYDRSLEWRPKEYHLRLATDDLTANAGLGVFLDLFYQDSKLFSIFQQCLPERDSNASYDTSHIAMSAICGFWAGQDCLDDLVEFKDDPLICNKLGGVPSPRAYGDYLRDFSDQNIKDSDAFLCTQALEARKRLAPSQPLIIDQDSTDHIQSGKKMEGLGFNYKDHWGLDSLVAFDELGFCHAMDLRPGSKFSSQDAPAMIRRTLGKRPFKERKYYRADSAFCNQECIEAAIGAGSKFTITAHDNINWTDKISGLTDWIKWIYSDEQKQWAIDHEVELPKVELSWYLYQPKWADNLRFPVVIKRTWVFNKKAGEWEWKHYAVVTNWSLHLNTLQQVIEFHAKRGNSENFIREEKYGWDLKHLPCQKLRANHAYALLAMVAHNFLRMVSLIDNPRRPHFAKKIRRKYVFIPGKLIRHSSMNFMKIPQTYEREVQRLIAAWANSLKLALDTG
jgi:hypothetical protein